MASPLLVICFLSLPLLMIVMVQKSALQGQGIAKPLAACSILSWIVTLPTAYALGFYTPLGYIGIYLSSIINYAIQLLVLYPFVTGNDVFRESWPGWNLSEALRLLRKLVPLGISNLLMTTFQMLGLIVVALLVGTLPDPAVATAVNGIFTSCASLSWTPMIGICIAGSIRMGNALGAGQARRASVISHVLLGLTCLFGILGMIVIVIFADPITRLFTVDEEIIRTTVQLFHSCAFGIPIVGSVFSFQAIFRACGEQSLCAKLLGFFVIVVGAPLGVVLATRFDQGIAGLWYGNCIGTLGMIAGTLLWLYYLDWEKMAHNTRLNTHLHVEQPDTAEAA
ncbi:hypothetical protein Poli38472_002613 [Pythium oligandrum]|uniref:Uncharacterized protein n=1 Tax=Pythium oligandrum TaxID=41045 RepID=A0A8K1CK23_PYTOL|nr:hypothetical protein Poli38472_002613 [Pythium oligandrum]|eukprot:TMW63672.1 hypothetical protein Poli38472_002613 [Pythium oligandrum]